MHPHQKYIDALLNNNEKLLYELYQKCFPVIRQMVLENNGTETNAADIFQDALLDLFRKAKASEFVLTNSVCAYIKGICRNKWYDELEKRKRLVVTFTGFEEQDMGEDSFKHSEERQLTEARLHLIKKKFKELGERCKELLRLSWSTNEMGKKRSTDELAAMLNMTNGYLRKKKSECIIKLIKLVRDDPGFKNLNRK